MIAWSCLVENNPELVVSQKVFVFEPCAGGLTL